MSEQPKRREPEVKPAPGSPKPPPEPVVKQPYRVLSRIVVDKIAHEPGAVVSLTPADAASLGGAVTSTLTVPVAEEIAKREAGLYEVAGPGSVWAVAGDEERSHSQPPGTLLELSAEDARDLGTAIRAVA
jgi:hypothetical protein